MEQSLVGIRCGGETLSRAALLCVQADCSSFAMMCNNQDCSCHALHIGHARQPYIDIAQALRRNPELPIAYQKADQLISDFIGDGRRCFERFADDYRAHIDKLMTTHTKHEQLKRQLLQAEQLDLTATGGAVSEILHEVRGARHIENPHLADIETVETVMGEMRERLAAIKSLSLLWKLEFSYREVGLRQLEKVPDHLKSIKLEHCESQQWQQLGKRLSALPSFTTALLLDCTASDSFCASISTSPRIRILHLVNCQVTDEGIKSLIKIRQLKELRLGQVDRNRWTINGFKTILRGLQQLPELDVLEMEIPTERELFIQRAKSGDRGIRFVAQNMPNLTSIIAKNNYITDEGARSIATGLKGLTRLIINHNSITDEGAKAIAEGLGGLRHLTIGFNHLTNEGVKAITKGLTSLNELSVKNCNLTDVIIRNITHGLKHLTSLWIEDNKLSQDGKQLIRNAYPNAQRLDL